MALKANSGTRTGSLFFLEPKGLKSGETAHFRTAKAVEGGKPEQSDDKTLKDVNGQLERVEFKTDTYENETKDMVVLWLNDSAAQETYHVKIGFTQVGRSIFNSILGIQAPVGDLSLSLYNRSKDGVAVTSVKHNGARASWKFTIDELDKYVAKVTKKKKDATGKLVDTIERDFAELNEFLLNELKAWVEKAGLKKAEVPSQIATTTGPEGNVVGNDEQELPF